MDSEVSPFTIYAEEDLLPLSALQHLLFCERQCALIHVERLWAENRLTVEGQHFHQRAHDESTKRRAGIVECRGLALRSLRLGLIGKADVVEFRSSATGARVPYPVEYKRGKPKAHDADRVQLCAQALCLEEMLSVPVPAGSLFYGKTRRRAVVAFDACLRELTESACRRLHALVANGRTPAAVREAKCDSCSLIELCMPDLSSSGRTASELFAAALDRALADGPAADVE
ncbi:MAG: CRISPR-associated protein Cas4 [Gemmatimonadaceae bacterium]